VKRVVAACLAYPIFWLGHLASLAMRACDRCHLYPVYHHLMCWSVDLNDWGGLKLWGPVERSDSQS
jgi:hypothetical protein